MKLGICKNGLKFKPSFTCLPRLWQEWLLLGRWISMARKWGVTDKEKAHLEFNARNVLTLWGPNGEIAGLSRDIC